MGTRVMKSLTGVAAASLLSFAMLTTSGCVLTHLISHARHPASGGRIMEPPARAVHVAFDERQDVLNISYETWRMLYYRQGCVALGMGAREWAHVSILREHLSTFAVCEMDELDHAVVTSWRKRQPKSAFDLAEAARPSDIFTPGKLDSYIDALDNIPGIPIYGRARYVQTEEGLLRRAAIHLEDILSDPLDSDNGRAFLVKVREGTVVNLAEGVLLIPFEERVHLVELPRRTDTRWWYWPTQIVYTPVEVGAVAADIVLMPAYIVVGSVMVLTT